MTAVSCSDDSPNPIGGPPPGSNQDASTPDKTAPTLVTKSPVADAENVWIGAPIAMTFSEPLAKASVNATSISVQSESGPVPVKTSLSADGREVRVLLESPHISQPTRFTINVANTVTDVAGNAFAGVSWSWKAPIWQATSIAGGAGSGSAEPALALDLDGHPIVASIVEASRPELRVRRFLDGEWKALGTDPLNVDNAATASSPRVAYSTEDGPVVVWREAGTEKHVYAKRFRDGKWEAMGAGALDAGAGSEASAPVVALDATGQPIVAWIQDNTKVEFRRWDKGAWKAFASAWSPGGTLADLVFEGTASVVAAVQMNAMSRDLIVARWSESAAKWQALGDPLDRTIEDAVMRPRLATTREGVIGITWQENDGYSDNVYAARYDDGKGEWRLFGHALDVDLDARAVSPSIGFGADGTPWVAWSEQHAARPRAYVARFIGDNWEFPGVGFTSDLAQSAGGVELVVDRGSNPVVLFEEKLQGDGGAGSQTAFRRYNGGPELAYGLAARVAPPCSFPADTSPDFPKTLTATKCFTDVPRRTPAPGLIPYDINSPLWSDGALKRRFVILPENGNMGYSDKFSWEMPVGSILVKEFLYEREPGNPSTIYPMETRFLVKRCEPGFCRAAWEGFSYQWTDEGTEATLLTNTAESVFKEWPSGMAKHRHGYPGRSECNQCHVTVAGGVLGLQTAQFNRNFDYGDTVDNQIRALKHAGYFGGEGDGGTDGGALDAGTTEGGSAPTSDGGAADGASMDAVVSDAAVDGAAPDGGSSGPASWPKLPVPNDPAFTTNERVRSYFHTNCSHCHRHDGRWPVIDFLYDAKLISENDPDTNICNELTPGNAETSRIFVKDKAREGSLPPDFFGDPMPPLASLLADERQLVILRKWIDGMKSCP
ncbi:MAG: Ig-like domain-containing protein [Polyangiaceae bacterium]